MNKRKNGRCSSFICVYAYLSVHVRIHVRASVSVCDLVVAGRDALVYADCNAEASCQQLALIATNKYT